MNVFILIIIAIILFNRGKGETAERLAKRAAEDERTIRWNAATPDERQAIVVQEREDEHIAAIAMKYQSGMTVQPKDLTESKRLFEIASLYDKLPPESK